MLDIQPWVTGPALEVVRKLGGFQPGDEVIVDTVAWMSDNGPDGERCAFFYPTSYGCWHVREGVTNRMPRYQVRMWSFVNDDRPAMETWNGAVRHIIAWRPRRQT